MENATLTVNSSFQKNIPSWEPPHVRGGLVRPGESPRAFFCTLCICHKSWSTAGHAGTTGHHAYHIYNLDCISQIKCIAGTHVGARQRPLRALRRSRATLTGTEATSQHPRRPAPTRLEPPLSCRGALTVAISRPPRAPQTGTKARARQRDPTTTLRPSTAAPQPHAPRTAPHPMCTLPPSAAAWARLRRPASVATRSGRPMVALLAARRRHIGGAHDCGRGVNKAN